MTKEEYNEKINIMNKCIEYWMNKAKKLEEENVQLKEKIRLMDEQEAKDIRSRFPC